MNTETTSAETTTAEHPLIGLLRSYDQIVTKVVNDQNSRNYRVSKTTSKRYEVLCGRVLMHLLNRNATPAEIQSICWR